MFEQRLSRTVDSMIPLIKEKLTPIVMQELTISYEHKLQNQRLSRREQIQTNFQRQLQEQVKPLLLRLQEVKQALAKRTQLLLLLKNHKQPRFELVKQTVIQKFLKSGQQNIASLVEQVSVKQIIPVLRQQLLKQARDRQKARFEEQLQRDAQNQRNRLNAKLFQQVESFKYKAKIEYEQLFQAEKRNLSQTLQQNQSRRKALQDSLRQQLERRREVQRDLQTKRQQMEKLLQEKRQNLRRVR